MKFLYLSLISFLFNFSFAQSQELLFEEIFSSDLLTEQDLEMIPTNAPYIVGKINSDVFSSKKIKYNSFNNEEVILNKIKTERQANALVWIGKIQNNSLGNSLLSIVNNTVWGKFENNNGTQIMLMPLSSNNNFVIMYETSMVYEDEDCNDEQSLMIDPVDDSDGYEIARFSTTDVCDSAAVCTADVVDLLIVYTNQAESNLGGSVAAAEAAIGLAVAEMNTINLNSGNTSKTFNLAAVEKINYAESGDFSVDLFRLRYDDDYMDDVHDLRDQYYADAVSLIVGSGGCGLGNVNTNNTEYRSDLGFSVCSNSCMTGNKSLAHEVGHNLGFRHDRYAYSETPTVVCSFAWGWVNPNAFGGTTDQKWRTVMAYNNECSDQGFDCIRVNHWSNPDVNFNSDPTGSDVGNPDEANNSDILDRAFCQVADFSEAPTCTDCEIVQKCEYYNINTASGPGNTTDIQITSTFTPISTLGSDAQICVYYYGDHSGSAETFNVFDENNILLGTTVVSNDCILPNRVCFNVTPSTFNNWIADGQVNISLDPTTTEINPNLCSANRACVELLIPTCVKPPLLTGTPQPSNIAFSSVDGSTWPSNLNNALLALESKEKGLVLTRMANPEVAIGTGANAVQGMLVYDTDDNCLKLYNGTAWNCITKGCPD